MIQNRFLYATSRVILIALVLHGSSQGQTVALANSSSERCTGYGELQSILLTDWEAGLESWTVGNRGVVSPSLFDTPDWAVIGNLPDSRPGLAAFVANLNAECNVANETGVLMLDSPSVVIPGGVQVPRISIDHFFAIEYGWDGGNLKISVNGGSFNPIPASAIEFGSYVRKLYPPVDDEGFALNSNPLANQDAFTGTVDGQATGSWSQSHINLLGIASAGDSVRLRIDFGIDECGGDIGWYVDDVEFYSCEAELVPSDCGNRVIDAGEQCDDGNDFIEDGCSNTCQIEEGWECTMPNLPGVIPDPGFEDGAPNSFWTESSTDFSSPICSLGSCTGAGGGSGPFSGSHWAWFGGAYVYEEGSLSQSVVIPATETQLTFEFEAYKCDSASDYLELLIDGNEVWRLDGSSPLCGILGYTTQSADISAYANGGTHDITFHTETYSSNGDFSTFFVDDVAMPGNPSLCNSLKIIFNDGFE